MSAGWVSAGVGLAGSAILGVSLVAGFGVTEPSSSSAFCGTCHVMKAYHASWSESTHREVACVECHVPAGLGPGIQKKLDGLAMVAKTLKGETTSHISAHVEDEVCLRCHERRLLVGLEWFDSVLFDHRPHLSEMRRGVQLNCSSCHSQIVQGDHITVTTSSCLVCHFLNREAGAAESECALCHQIEGLVAERGGRRFDHTRAAELGTDCEACHEPVSLEASVVPRERCLTCHNRPGRLEMAEVPVALMEAHIGRSRALCGDCHQNVEHVGRRREGSDLSRCEGCHQPRLSPALALYAGLEDGSVGPVVSPMYLAGVRCEGCHPERSGMIESSPSSVSCLQCHPLGIERLFEWWRETVNERQVIARRLFERTAAELGPVASSALGDADREIEWVERGRGVHNLERAMSLLDSAVDRIAEVRGAVGLTPLEPPWPDVELGASCLRCHRGMETRSSVSFGRDFGHTEHVTANLECEKCHSTHERRREEGVASLLFDEPECQGCHHEKIESETCASCHQDTHRAQFADEGCGGCHAADYWIPALGFEHETTAYPLAGKHRDVACADCHVGRDAEGGVFARYRGLNFERCEDCHDDPHATQLGSLCEDCHVAAGWDQVDHEGFDHEVTRYPLRGGHVATECGSCHPAGESYRVESYESCADCHEDKHMGQFAALDDGGACEPCHTVEEFLPTVYSPDHHQESSYPLRGAHLAVPCDSCHREIATLQLASQMPLRAAAHFADAPETAVQFRFASIECVSCHEDPHAGSTDEFMAERGCEVCHSETSWSGIAFDHRLESFALEGKHRDVACIECHPRLPAAVEGAAQMVQLRGVPLTCEGCHENPHATGFASGARTTDCERCHTAESWAATPFDHRRDTRFPLVAAHTETSCGGCHPDTRYEEASTECRDCHADPHRGELGLVCDRCHTPHSWNYNVEALTSHSATLFPLDGAHATLDCAGCHTAAPPFEFSSTPTDCYACHEPEYRETVDPDHELLSLSTECAECHETRSWIGASIGADVDLNHDAIFELVGAHRGLDCIDCHSAGYGGTPRDCLGCHRADFDRTSAPNHQLAAFPVECELCHSTDQWQGVTWSHGPAYTLEGAHVSLDCVSCHGSGFSGGSSDCYTCHREDFASTVEPDHQAAGFDRDCSVCHTQRRWDRASYEHPGSWPLTGAHRGLACEGCHADGYEGTSGECYSCHRRDYRRVVDPDHRAAGFGTSCDECHRTQTWSEARLDHNLVFYLSGAHRDLDCGECHAEGYTGTPRDCFGCHRDDYDSVRDPDHRGAGFDTNCTACHSTDTWSGAGVDHQSTFLLTGAHRALDCLECHAAGYAGTPRECIGCHLEDYNGTRDPDHRAAGFANDCTRCHTTERWPGAVFEHGSSYRLTGAHIGLGCESCHAERYAGTPSNCAGCHMADYDATRQPDHRDVGFSTDCEQCHTSDSWLGADFNHDGYYVLTGAHARIDCGSCHTGGSSALPTDCIGCHMSDYNSATNPDHRDAGFPSDCTYCHTTERWQGAVFDHDLYYPLVGMHSSLDCSRCHEQGYEGTPNECFGCHLDDYKDTVRPDHTAAEFPVTCDDCHTPFGWYGAIFADHDVLYFPIYSGTHEDLWGSCNTCHRLVNDFSYFTCTVCHNHSRDRMDRVHVGVVGYEFENSACYACHPTGQAP